MCTVYIVVLTKSASHHRD